MVIKDLLVHIDNSEDCKQRVADAMALAEQNDAHLTGIYVIQNIILPYTEMGASGFIYAELEKQNNEDAEKMAAAFEQWTRSWRSKSSWLCLEGDSASTVAKHSAYFDIVVVGRRNADQDQSQPLPIVDRMVVESGRPTLVIPPAGAGKSIGSRILVAWNGQKEAARAVHDALPFLKEAEAVEVVTINGTREVDVPCSDIAEHLARHGVNVEIGNTQTKSKDTGEAILYLAQGFAADLIVMGAYGHSRLRETVLGGVTRHILENAKIPVMMSH